MAKKTSKFRMNVAQDVERREKQGRSYGYLNIPKGVTLFKEMETKGKRVLVDIIPYLVTIDNHPDYDPDNNGSNAEKGTYWYKRPFWIHRSIGADNDTIVCPKTIGEKCPICEYRQKQVKEGVRKEHIIPKPSMRMLYNVVPLNQKDFEDDKIHLWDISYGNFQKELDESLKEWPLSVTELLFSPDEGYTLSIRFSDESFASNKYKEATRIDYEEREMQYDEAIVDEAAHLDDCLTILPYKDIEALFLEIDPDDIDEPEDEPETETRRGSSIRRKKKHEDVDDDPEEDEPEEEERKSKSIRRKRSTKSDPEEDHPRSRRSHDHDPEPEEEETTSPRKRSKAVTKSEPEEEKEEVTSRRRKRTSKEDDDGGECPSGYKFGKDWDEYPECENCKVFQECGDAYEKMQE